MRGAARLVGALALAGAVVAPAPAFAADDASIDHSEHADGTLTLLVSVPGTQAIDLKSLKLTIGGETVDAAAAPAESTDKVQRTTGLASDTSSSMRGTRIREAKRAAATFLANVPANVLVGIVTFDNTVQVRQQPSTDRNASTEVLRTMPLRINTKLYDGVRQAIRTAGGADAGQRQVLLLSDGADNTGAKIDPLVPAIQSSGVKLDVVSLQQEDTGNAALQRLAEAGKGSVIDAANPESLSKAFKDEADALARQVVVTAKVPDAVSSADADVDVSLTAGGEEHSTRAFLAIRDHAAKGPTIPKAPTKHDYRLDVPKEAVYGGLVAIFLGIVGVVWAFSSGRKPKLGIAEQIAAYGTGADRQKLLKKQSAPTDSLKESAKAAAESMLASNKSFEARIANRLDGAGMSLKPAEWILLHTGIVILFALVGLLAGGGTNVPLLIMFLFVGAFAPWIYLSFKRSRRHKAFAENLADTLQLMSGSLSAGMSLAQSLDTTVREGTEPMTSEFKRVIAETRLGVALEDALDGVAERMNSKDFRWVIMAIRIQREVGGNLAELLLTVAATLRERQYLRRQVQTLSAEGRLSAYILGGLPPTFLAYLTATKPAYVGVMFSDPRGWVLLGIMSVLLVVGFFWMLKVAKVEV